VPNVPSIERLVNILDDHHPDALRAAGLFEQIIGESGGSEVRNMLMIAATSSASRPHLPMQSSKEMMGLALSSRQRQMSIENQLCRFDPNQ
jgi:hypothetical protein